MNVVYGLIPFMLFFGFLVVVVFIWMAKKGQFDDLDGAAHSIFLIDEDAPESSHSSKSTHSTSDNATDDLNKNKSESVN